MRICGKSSGELGLVRSRTVREGRAQTGRGESGVLDLGGIGLDAIGVDGVGEQPRFGQSLAALDLAQLAVEITAIRRRNVRTVEPGPDAVIEENDIVVLLGTEDAVASAEIKLLQG